MPYRCHFGHLPRNTCGNVEIWLHCRYHPQIELWGEIPRALVEEPVEFCIPTQRQNVGTHGSRALPDRALGGGRRVSGSNYAVRPRRVCGEAILGKGGCPHLILFFCQLLESTQPFLPPPEPTFVEKRHEDTRAVGASPWGGRGGRRRVPAVPCRQGRPALSRTVHGCRFSYPCVRFQATDSHPKRTTPVRRGNLKA